ncbi:jg11742 [Pararge aegeria aegeria]|uniref:Jg11742 protein n=1 Tax=Pararge aegeria aegeria TaxID=348720 RepID=A0A8S4SNK8_9NEOP|nr:jg11742 [Pararge aegeria aegeria]
MVASICFMEVVPQEIATPASFLEPRNFNYHPYQLQQYLEESKPTKQGPVLFPSDGPPAPRRPLIVTARPLIESIANSDRNPDPPNSSITQNNIPLNPAYPIPSPAEVTLTPDLLAKIAPITSNDIFANPRETSINNVPEASTYNHVPYAEMLLKARLKGYVRGNGFNDYEERTVLPPIYRALSNHARQNVLKPKPANRYNYQRHNVDYENQYENNGVSDENDSPDYDQDQNYAFSYRVKDQKTGDDFSHKQESVSGGTNGEYRVRLPDGRTQIVSYTADETGYKADVRYDNENGAENANKYINTNNNYDKINQNNHVNPNNNLVTHYPSNGLNTNINRDYVNIRQYDDQNVESNYFKPQTDNIKDYEDLINFNNYVNHANNVKQQVDFNPRNDYVNYKDSIPIKEDPNEYNSKEYYDYSSDYSQNYEPYNSKFAIFKPTTTSFPIVTTERPYTIKPLFTVAPTKGFTYADGVISASNNPVVKYESTTENVVLIGGKKVYTNVKHVLPTELTSTARNFVAVTPASYLASTIASLRDRITSKPVVLGNFINRINKYLSYK